MGKTTFSGPVVSQGGFIDASFTSAERDAIVSPQPGLLIYNTTENNYQVYTGTVWDSAFGGGGGGGAFPYLLSKINTYSALSSPNGQAASKLLFNANGTQVLDVFTTGMTTVYVNTSNLAIPYDPGTFMGADGFSFYSPNAAYSGGLGAYLKPDGTVLYILVATNNYTVQVTSFTLNTPFDLTSVNPTSEVLVSEFTIGSSMYYDVARGFEISADGTKMMFSVFGQMGGVSYLRTFNLSTPFDPTTINGQSWSSEANITSYVNALHYMGSSQLFGLAVDSTGKTVYTTVNGYVGTSYPATFVLEFKLGTAYDASSIQASYNQPVTAGTDLSNNNCGVTLANGNIYIGNYDMMYQANYSVNSLTAIAKPNITSVSPSSGTTGTLVTIDGSGFTGTTAVKFGGTNVDGSGINVIGDTKIQVSAPATGTNAVVDVEVTNPAGSSTKTKAFTNTSPPTATYTLGVDYNAGGTQVSASPDTLIIIQQNWITGGYSGIQSKVDAAGTSGVTFEVNYAGGLYTAHTTGPFSSLGPMGYYGAPIMWDGASPMVPGQDTVNSITI